MRIGGSADRLNVTPQTVRYSERLGLLPPRGRTAAGYRIYREADIERLTFIKTSQRLGIALDEIGEILALRDRGAAPCDYVRGVLCRQVAEIDRRLDELTALRAELVALDRLADGLPAE